MCNYVLHLLAQLSSIPLIIVSVASSQQLSLSPLAAVTISHFSKLFYQRIHTFSPFKGLFFFTPSHLAVSFSSSHSPPPLSPTHPVNQSFIPFSFSSPCYHVSNFTFPSTVLSWVHPLLTCVCPLFLLCFSYFPFPFIALLFRPTDSVFIFSSIPLSLSPFHSFRLPFLPLVLSLLCLFPPLLLCPHLFVSGTLFVLSSL